jgi:hypothetical protein
MKWFRLWHDLVDNQKIQTLPPAVFMGYINSLCIASRNTPRGTLPKLPKYAFQMRMSQNEAQKMLEKLESRGFLHKTEDGYSIHDWEEHQRNSDNIAVRVQRHREKSNVTGNVTGNVSETEAETDFGAQNREEETREKNREEKNPPTPQGGDDGQTALLPEPDKKPKPSAAEVRKVAEDRFNKIFWPIYPHKKSKVDAIKAWVKLNPDDELIAEMIKAIENQAKEKEALKATNKFCPEWPNPSTWLNNHRWTDEVTIINHSTTTTTPPIYRNNQPLEPASKEKLLRDQEEFIRRRFESQPGVLQNAA